MLAELYILHPSTAQFPTSRLSFYRPGSVWNSIAALLVTAILVMVFWPKGGGENSHRPAAARALLAARLAGIGIKAGDLPELPKTDSRKVIVASEIRRQTAVPLAWIAQHLRWAHHPMSPMPAADSPGPMS